MFCHVLPFPYFHSLLLKRRSICCGELHLSKVVGFVQEMVLYEGKCAGCGVSRNHKNFKGRRDRRPLPNPCYVALRKRRKVEDDRLYF